MSHQARKRFGQNFLHDKNVIQRIVSAVNPQPGDRLVEIGPGQGAITRHLLDASGELVVIELDRDLVEPLSRHCGTHGRLQIYNEDALRFDFATLATDTPIRLVGNLPYNISTPLLFHLLNYAGQIQDMFFMLQNEVVDRLAAQPNSRDYGRLSVMMQTRCHVNKLFTIGPGAFSPAPRVDSAFVQLIPHSKPLVRIDNPAFFEKLVKQAFAQRRKTLRNNLRLMADTHVLQAVGIDPGQRAETLSIEQFARLANQLEKTG